MGRKLLIGILGFSLLLELVAGFGGLFAPALFIQKLNVAATPDTAFLFFSLAGNFVFGSLICLLALKQVMASDPHGWTLSYILGGFWVALGLGIYFIHGRPANLVLDSLKGALVLIFAVISRPRAIGHGSLRSLEKP